LRAIQVNNQRHFSFKFDQAFFSFLFDSLKIIKDESLSTLAVHVYACILNEISTSNFNPNFTTTTMTTSVVAANAGNINLNENLLKAINSQIVDFLFEILVSTSAKSYVILKDNLIVCDRDNIATETTSTTAATTREDKLKMCFDDKQLLACRCLPLIVNILHLSLPDKRLVDLPSVIDKLIFSMERIQRDFIKYELIRSYLIMLSECCDRAALKIAIVSKKFFIGLLEQVRLICLINNGSDVVRLGHSHDSLFLHECILVVLHLIKNLLDNSQTVKVSRL
jgi:hypothetical protein